MSVRERVPQKGVSGRTHKSAPTRWGRRLGTNENWRETGALRGGTEPAPYRGRKQGGFGRVKSPRPTGATLVGSSGGPMYLRHGFRRPNFVSKFGASVIGIGPFALRGTARRVVVPYGWLRRVAAIALGNGAQRSVCGAGANRGRDHPQRGHQRRTIPQSRRSRASSLYTREPWGTGDGGVRSFSC